MRSPRDDGRWTRRILIGLALGFLTIFLFVPLIFVFWRHLSFEKARQGESDTGPTGVAAMFQSSDDDDEEDDE